MWFSLRFVSTAAQSSRVKASFGTCAASALAKWIMCPRLIVRPADIRFTESWRGNECVHIARGWLLRFAKGERQC
jgi:hypothetical protein